MSATDPSGRWSHPEDRDSAIGFVPIRRNSTRSGRSLSIWLRVTYSFPAQAFDDLRADSSPYPIHHGSHGAIDRLYATDGDNGSHRVNIGYTQKPERQISRLSRATEERTTSILDFVFSPTPPTPLQE